MNVSRGGKLVAAIAAAGIYWLCPTSAGAAVVTNGCANANVACTVQELVGGASITVSDKLFSGWSASDASTLPLDLSAISVSALDDPLNPGLLFSGGGQLRTTGLDQIDLDLGFVVGVLGGIPRMVGSALTLGEFAFGAGNVGGLVKVDASIFGSDGVTLLGSEQVLADNLFPFTQLSASSSFAARAEIVVATNILVTGDPSVGADEVSLGSFSQRFLQQAVPVPEPPPFAILSSALVALWLARRGSRRARPDMP